LCIWGLHPDSPGGWVSPLGQAVHCCLVGSSPGGPGMHPSDKGDVAGISSWDTGHWGSLAGSNVLLCQHRLSSFMSKVWAPKTKRSHLIYPCKRVTEAKRKA
jgi:hypothetical protein